MQRAISQYKNGVANKLQEEDSSAHRWYRFVLSFPPHLVRDYLNDFGIRGNKVVLDPFCGTGTTLVECKKHGIPSIGIEALPMAHFASKVKTDWTPDPKNLSEHANKIAEKALRRLEAEGIQDFPFFSLPPESNRGLRKLPQAAEKMLLKNSISPLPLHKTLTLMEVLEEERDHRFYRHERLALAKALVDDISNLYFGPEIGVRKMKDDAPVISPWLVKMSKMVEDLQQLPAHKSVIAKVYLGDARQLSNHLDARSVDAVITSPPYPNEKDYTRTTRMESVLLGFVHNMEELRTLKKTLVRSNTRNVYKADDDDLWVSGHFGIKHIAEKIEKRRQEMGKNSGFERLYPRVTKLYFGGMTRHLESIKRFLKPGAMLAYVVGDQASYLRVMIRTGRLLADIAKSLGYEVIRTDLFRTRLATITKQKLREEVLVLRWPGK